MDRNDPRAGGPLGGAAATAGVACSASGQTVGGVGREAGNTVGGVANSAARGNANGNVATAQDPMGIPGVTLSAAAANQMNGSVFTSNSKNVKLDSGSMLSLRVMAQ